MKNYKNFKKLLNIERGAKITYDRFLKEIKDPDFVKNITFVRNQEIEHVILAQSLLEMLGQKEKKIGARIKKMRAYPKENISDMSIFIKSAVEILHNKIKLISLLEKLDKLNLKLQELNRLKSEFVSITAHQLKSPLTSMKWFFELILGGSIGKLSKTQKEYFQDIYFSNEKLVALVDDLLKISRLEELKLQKKIESVDLVQFFRQILKKYRLAADVKELKITILEPKTVIRINSYTDLLENIIDNLLSNAIKYTPKGGRIEIKFSRQEKFILTQVSDTGIGIPSEDASRIFEKFFRAENAKKADLKGTGLGLSIARDSAEKLGGKIWFEPNKPRGTIFYFLLPIIKYNH